VAIAALFFNWNEEHIMSVTYRVIAVGFEGGVLYEPDGKRNVLVRDEPYPGNKTPVWLKRMDTETKEEKKARDDAAKQIKDKVAENKKEVVGASFLHDDKADHGKKGGVESL
jgi:hypothetical protein